MPQLDVSRRTARCVLVYHGPRGAGKTETLRAIRRALPADRRGDVQVRPSGVHPTLFLEHLRVRPCLAGDVTVELDLVALPDHEALPLLGELLTVTDGVVFVADSRAHRAREDRLALLELERALRASGVDPARLPFAFQWNKRDLAGALAPLELARAVGARGRPGFACDAASGDGVLLPLREVALAAARRVTSPGLDAGSVAAAVPSFGHVGALTSGRARRAA